MMQAFPFTSNALVRRVKDARLDLLTDPRSRRGRRYDFQALVWTLLLSMSVGARGLRQAEDLTRRLPPGIRRVTKIWRRISDTRLRDTLFMLDYDELRSGLHRTVKAEARPTVERAKAYFIPLWATALPKSTLWPLFIGLDGHPWSVHCFSKPPCILV